MNGYQVSDKIPQQEECKYTRKPADREKRLSYHWFKHNWILFSTLESGAGKPVAVHHTSSHCI